MVKLILYIRGIFYLFLIIILSYGCPHDINDSLTIIINNNSEETIVFYKTYSLDSVKDTILPEEFPWGNSIDDFYIIKPFDNTELIEIKSDIEYIVSQGWYQYYLFNYDSINAIPWEQIKSDYIIAKRYDFDDLRNLEKLDYTINYP